MKRLMARRAILELLVVLGVLISGCQMADVDSEADDMAKRIEEESKKVEDQSNAMVSEIEAKGKNVEDADQEKKFEAASKQVDDIMDKGEKEVDDKENFAEELENEADKKVEEIGKKIDETSNRGYGISRKRRASDKVSKVLGWRPVKGEKRETNSSSSSKGTKMSSSGNSGLKSRMTVSYPLELPNEESAGEEIEDAMKDGEHLMRNEYERKSKDIESTATFSGPQDFTDYSNNEAEETEDLTYQAKEPVDSFSQQQDFVSSQDNENKETGKASLRHGQLNESASESPEFGDKDGNEIEEIDAAKQGDSADSLNFSDEQEGVSMQNDTENGNEDIENIMVLKQREPTVNGFSDQQKDENEDEDVTTTEEHVDKSEDKEDNEDRIVDDSAIANNVLHKNDDSEEKEDSLLEQEKPLAEKNEEHNNDEHGGAIYDVDVYTENSNSSSNVTKMDQKGAENSTFEGSSSAVVPQTSSASGEENDTQAEYSSDPPMIHADAQGKHDPPVEINFSPSVQLLKPDQKLLNEIEEDRALRLKQKERKQHAKEPKRDIVASARAKEKPKTEEVSGKAKDKIEPSKVVVLPDVAIRGTDSNNMQIKELKSQKSHGIWLAVHIPDNATALRPVKILSTKKAADDLEKIIGPNKETMFKELQSIIGVDGATLRKMLKAGQIDGRRNRKMHRVDDDEDEDEEEEEDEDSDGESDEDGKEEEEKEDEEEDDSGDDTKCQDDENDEEDAKEEEEEEDEDEEEDDEGKERKHKNKQKQGKLKIQSKQMDKTSNKAGKKPKHVKKCSGNKQLPWILNDGGSGAEANISAVLQPEGHDAPLANVLNKINVRLKRKKACKHPKNPIIKELCKQMDRHHRNPRPNWNQPRRHLHISHKKYYRHLRRLMRKFLSRHSGRQAQQVLQYMNLLLSDQLRLSPDGIVHLYPNGKGRANNYGDGFKALADDNSGTKGRNSPPLEPPIIDDNMYNGNVIRVPVPGSTRGTTTPNDVGIMSNSQANVLNNQVHTKLGDPHSSEGDTHMQMLKEELGRANEELREQQKEKQRDDAIMDKYMFNFQSLAEKGPINAFDGMQKDAEQRVNGQQVSVIDPNQISLKESRLPIRNRLDVPSLGGYVGGQFTGYTRRNRIQNYLKNIAKHASTVPAKEKNEY